ncbi:coiled-coil domain-containing protein 96 [Hemicordylus capensis]|uniref:coiled-coil domain-containing protein 96 n=1 Tax=Hemicordylus capensis TaxID=884348 RepID=UPI002304C58C|nr:coiled-coil domain-containing protein 96 [Hemicordylus capensis]
METEPISPEPAEAPGDAATPEAVEASPSSSAVAAPIAEESPVKGEAAAEGEATAAAEEEKPGEEPTEEPPAGEEASDGQAEEEEAPAPLEGAIAGQEPSPAEEEEEEEGKAAEDESGGEDAAAAAAAAEELPQGPEEAPSSAFLVPALPTSVSFAEGEPLEPEPLQIGVDLSRRLSVSLRELESIRRTSPEPNSPEDEESLEEPGETEQEVEARLAEEERQRTELVEEYRQLVSERSRLRHYNTKLQGKLADLLNKAKAKELPRAELEQHISDKEQRYNRYLAMLEELRNQQTEEMAWYQRQIDALQRTCEEKLATVNAEWKTYLATKKDVAVYTMGRRLGGKQAAIKQVELIQSREQSKEKEMTEVRLENIKLKHRIQKLEASLKAQEELAEGLHLIDFEQLKIENQTYNEKIEERNEELLKLRKKITNTVQVLTQLKEKLQFVEGENQGQKAQLMAVEALVAQKRDHLTRTKQARDRLRIDNQKLHQRCGLLGNTLLLRDFESKVEAAETLKQRLEILKRRHAGLSLACRGVKKKISGVNSFLPV